MILRSKLCINAFLFISTIQKSCGFSAAPMTVKGVRRATQTRISTEENSNSESFGARAVKRLFRRQNHRLPAETFQNLLLSRRTINDFEADLPAHWREAVHRAVEAATFAPNHKRTEPWRFHLLGPNAIRRVCELNAELVAATKGPEASLKKLERWLAMPGWLVVTCVRSNASLSLDDPSGAAREDYAACCCAVQNLCLSLHADGIGTKWTTGPVNFDARFAKAAGLSSNEYVVGTIWFGTPASAPKPPVKKLSVDDVLINHD